MLGQTDITVLVITYNWPEALERCLRSLFGQTLLPKEIVIADDGSDDRTRTAIERLRGESPVPIVHVWHEDIGFRKTLILNKAIARISTDYIIQVDGDVVPERHFVEDHAQRAQRGYYVCGSRVHLNDDVTSRMIKGEIEMPSFADLPFKDFLNGVRVGWLRRFLELRYGRNIAKQRGCNMAFWKDDLVKVNGYNEDFVGWGHEDMEIVYRLHFAGVDKKFLKFGAVVYHLNHKISSKHNAGKNLDAVRNVIANRISRCPNGLDKHIGASETTH